MNTLERRQEILNTTVINGKVSVEELAKQFNISAVTIRSDLNLLHKKGLIVRSHGGAVATSRLAQELSIEQKHDENAQVKIAIGKFAASFIKANESIIIDSGTTTEEIARHLIVEDGLIVMTNGLNIAQELSKHELVEVMMTGGTLRKKSASFYGRPAEETLRKMRFNRLFMGVDGFDIKTGVTTHFEPEASLNTVMCEVSSEVFVVTDSSKFGRNSVHVVTEIPNITCLITDEGIPDKLASELDRQNVKLYTVANNRR